MNGKRHMRVRSVTPRAAAAGLGLELEALEELVATGIIWRIRVRGERRIPLSELRRFAARQWQLNRGR